MDEETLDSGGRPSVQQATVESSDTTAAVSKPGEVSRSAAAVVSSIDSQTTLSTDGGALEKEMSNSRSSDDESEGQHDAIGSAEEDDVGDVTITMPDHDEADDSAVADDSKQSFSSDELVELRQFNEKKEQIEEQYKLLQSRPMPETFSALQALDVSEAMVDATFAELPMRKAELQDWLAEHERIENDAVAFNVADMNRLRTVAKAAAGRHMSPQDTDLIELTVETLVALDKLLLLLNERRRQLDLLAARMEWEERRAACWKAYHPLMEDIGLFVQKRARWTAAAYSRAAERPENDSETPSLISHAPTEDSLAGHLPAAVGKASSSLPSEERKALLLEALNAELNALSSRLRELVTELVPAAGEALDGLIDQCQVPEPYLEEQDQLENMALNMTARGVFMTSLAAQWRKANDLYIATRSLHYEAKELLADAEITRTQIPTQALYDKMASTSAALNARLEELAGSTARRFVDNPSQSAHSLVFSSANHLPTPLHDAWEDQVGQNALIATHLDRDLAAAAKRTRQAAMTVRTYSRGLIAAQRAETLKRQLQQATQDCERTRSLAVDGFNPGPGTSSSNNADAGTRPDLSSADCLLPSRHSLYVRRLPEEQQRLTKIAVDTGLQVDELKRCLETCVRYGLTHASIKQSGDLAISRYQDAEESAAEAIHEGSELVALLQQARSINSGITRLNANAGQLRGDLEMAARSAAFSPKGKGWDVTVAPRPTAVEAKDRLRACLKDLEQVNSQAGVLDSMRRSQTATGVREKLDSDRARIGKQVDQLRAFVTWYTSLCQQESSVRALNRQMGSLRKQAAEIKDRSSANRSGAPDLPSLQSAKAEFDDTVQKFERKATTGTVFTGDPPDRSGDMEEMVVPSAFTHKVRSASMDLTCKLPLASHDEEVRECVNAWCTDAKALQEQVASAVAAMEQEAARLKPIAEASSKRNMRFDAAVNAALEAVQELSEEVGKRETGFNELMSTSGSFGELRVYRDDSREVLTTKEKELGSRMDALRECQREMISSLYSTGKPVMGDNDASSTASAIKVRNTVASTLKSMRRTLASFDDQLTQSSAGRRSMSTSFSKSEIIGDESVGDVSQDVFGPRQTTVLAQPLTAAPAVDYDALIRTLRNDQLDAQTVEDGQPQLEALLDLPEPSQDRNIQAWWKTARADLQEHLQASRLSSGSRRLASAVEMRGRSVVRHRQLMQFRSKATDLEQILSTLLNMLDFNGGRSTSSSMENLSGRSSRAPSPYLASLDQIESLQQRLRQSLDELDHIAEPIVSDARVAQRLQQLTRTAKDILADAKDFGQTPVPSSSVIEALEDLDDTESVASSISSVPSSLASVEEEEHTVTVPEPVKQSKAKATPSHIRRPSTLVPNGAPLTPVNSAARRSVSEQTPASSKLPTRLRRLKSNISQPQTPRLTTPKVPASPRVGPSKLPVRTPSSEYKRKAPETPAARYRANPKSKLDVAVGKIVNHLPVSVKIAHASTGPNAKKQEAWKDESGRYWIGDPEPKLCFCRILRSRTVMVRVGGGWQELSSYVMQHYSHLTAASIAFPLTPGAGRSPQGVSPRAVRLNATDLPWISSATISRSTTTTLEVPPVVLTPAEEDRKPRFGSEGPESIGPGRPFGAMASRASTPALSISPSTSPALSPVSSTSAMFDTPGAMHPQRLRKIRGGSSRQSLDISVLMPRHPAGRPVPGARRTPSPNPLDHTANAATLRASPGPRSPLHLQKGSMGPITPQRPIFSAGSPSPEGILPLFIRKENSMPPFRSVSGSSRI